MSKQELDQFITKNYNFFLSTSKNIISTNRLSEEEHIELVSFLVLSLYEGKVKAKCGTELGLLKVCVMFLRNQYKWPLSDYNKQYKAALFSKSPFQSYNKGMLKYEGSEYINTSFFDHSAIVSIDSNKELVEDYFFLHDEHETFNMELEAEQCSPKAKDYIKSLLVEGYTEDQLKRLLNIYVIYELELSIPEKILYNTYFNEDQSTQVIAKRLRLPVSSVYTMVKSMKQRIKQLVESNEKEN